MVEGATQGQDVLVRTTPYKMETFGKTPSERVIDRNLYIIKSLESHLIGGSVEDSIVFTPTESMAPQKGKTPPKSVTIIALSATEMNDNFSTDMKEDVKNERISSHLGAALMHQVGRKGGLREDLGEYQEDGKIVPVEIVGARKIKHELGGSHWTPIVIADIKTNGQEGIDQIVLAGFWDAKVAEEGMATLKSDLSEKLGKGESVSPALLGEFVESLDNGRKYSPNILKMLIRLGKSFTKKRFAKE